MLGLFCFVSVVWNTKAIVEKNMNVDLHSIAGLLHRVWKEKASSDLKKKETKHCFLFPFFFLLPGSPLF